MCVYVGAVAFHFLFRFVYFAHVPLSFVSISLRLHCMISFMMYVELVATHHTHIECAVGTKQKVFFSYKIALPYLREYETTVCVLFLFDWDGVYPFACISNERVVDLLGFNCIAPTMMMMIW